MTLHWTFAFGGWIWPLALILLAAIGGVRAMRPPSSPVAAALAKSVPRRVLERVSLSVGLGLAGMWAIGAMAERMLPDMTEPDGFESADQLDAVTGLRVMAVTPFHRGEALDTLRWKLDLVPYSARRRAMQVDLVRVHGDCEAVLATLLEYRDYQGVVDEACSTEEQTLEATAAVFTGDIEGASELLAEAGAGNEEAIRVHLLAGEPARAAAAARAVRDRFLERLRESEDVDLERWSITYDCLAAGLDPAEDATKLDAIYAQTRAIECRLLQAWRASDQQRLEILRSTGGDSMPFADTAFESAARLMFLELDPTSSDGDASSLALADHVLNAGWGEPTGPLERAALEALERAPDVSPGSRALLRTLRIRAALDEALFHRYDEARGRLAELDDVEEALALVDLWAGDAQAAAARGVLQERTYSRGKAWLDAAQGRSVEKSFWRFDLVEPALGPTKTFPAELYAETAMHDGFLPTLAPLAPFLPAEGLAKYMQSANLHRSYRFRPDEAITYLVHLAHIHEAAGSHALAERRLSTAEVLREAWTPQNAVPLLILDQFVWLAMNDGSEDAPEAPPSPTEDVRGDPPH